MRSPRRLLVPVLALALASGLTACSSGSSSGEPESLASSSAVASSEATPDAAESTPASPAAEAPAATSAATPAVGETITGTGYSYSVPEGWGVPPDTTGLGTDSVALDLAATGVFASNVNVVLTPSGAVTPDQVEAAGPDELEASGATAVAVLDRVTVAGSESAHLTATMTAEGVEYYFLQYYPTNAGQTFVVTFSYAPSVPGADATAIADAVLASWTWG